MLEEALLWGIAIACVSALVVLIGIIWWGMSGVPADPPFPKIRDPEFTTSANPIPDDYNY